MGLTAQSEAIEGRGPSGETLAIDIVSIGATLPRRALVVLSGVHGVEGFVNAAIQCDILDSLREPPLPDDLGIVMVHGVNPWGMAHLRRQNEHNVDLNRNWARDRGVPEHNDAYDLIHPLVCPDSDEAPDFDDLLEQMAPFLAEHGEEWVRTAITQVQYRHDDGLHFGGDRTEESNLVMERVLVPGLGACERLFVIDLHTGEGPYGELVVLSDQPTGSAQDELLRSLYDEVRTTAGGTDDPGRVKRGPIARGIVDDVTRGGRDVEATVATIEVGTAGDMEQLEATFHEQWLYRTGRAGDPSFESIRHRYLRCYTPDDADWAGDARRAGVEHVTAALGALIGGA